MKFAEPLFRGTWVKRYKRFLVDVLMETGETLTAHCPNSGSMLGCGKEGAPVMLSHHPNKGRKLEYSLELVKPGRCWIGVNTMRTNRIVEEALKKKAVPELFDYDYERSEIPHGKSRFDFSMMKNGKRLFLEVKNVSLVEKGVAMFPDARTERGARHLDELAEICADGGRAAVLFLVQRNDAVGFAPAEHIDLAFANALRNAARSGVMTMAYRCNVTTRDISLATPLEIVL